MKDNKLETFVGILVLIFCFAFVFFIKTSFLESKKEKDILLFARFNNIEGVVPGAEIKISGIKVGSVKNVLLDYDSFSAMVELSVSENVKLPTDSTVFVRVGNLIGGKYLEISPGNDEDYLKNGDTITFTQSSIIFEELIGKILIAFGKKNQ